ncbi:MAG TPA: aminotransferase class V-fold PLP-dependent enzyme, partial [Roseivirga sp.]
MDKRTFLKHMVGASLASTPFFNHVQKIADSYSSQSALAFAQNEDFWAKIRQDYLLKQEYVNLENGYYSMLPQPTLEKYIQHIKEVNYQASYYMRTVQWENKAKSVEGLAKLAHCTSDELIITRNTTESLDTIIQGYPWKKGDEAVVANQDY